VLLAEDNPTNQLVAMQMLESLGATVTLARDGAEALEIAEAQEFDVMLVDIEMPRVDGVEVIRRIRAWSGPRAQLPMIALTAYVMREHRAAIDAAGADGVIAKPILSIEQLGADIARFMSGRAAVSAAPGESTAEDARPVIDRSVYDTLAQAIGPSAMAELLEKVDADVRLAQSRLSQALEARDVEEIRSAAHILVSVAGAIGAVRVQQGAKKLDAAADQGDLARLAREAPGLFGEIEHMLEVVCANQAG
jgi:CheY-like chemotaxis protein